MHPAQCLRLSVLAGAIALAAWAIAYPPTYGTTVEPNEWFGRATRGVVGRATSQVAFQSNQGPQLAAELVFLGWAACLVMFKAGSGTDRTQMSRACSLGSHTATVAMLCLPFGRGYAAQQIGIVAFFEEVWSSPLLWTNVAALYVAWRKPVLKRSAVDRLILWALWIAVASWAVLFGAGLLEDFSPMMRWLASRQMNSGVVAASIAVLFAALAGTFQATESKSFPPAADLAD